MRSGIAAILLLLGGYGAVKAQTDADILRYSMLNYGATARSLAMGNSFGALGADFSCLSMNPAGMGLYRKGEFTISPLFSNRNINSEYIGQNADDNYFKFALGNFGIVWAGTNKKKGASMRGWAFGLGYNKLNDFNGRYIAQAPNPKNSLLDNHLEAAVGVAPEDLPYYYPYDVDLSWQTYLLDTVMFNDIPYYYTAVPFAGTLQRKTVETKGGQGEWDFSFAGNFGDMLYMGLTFGFTTLRYEEESVWDEQDFKDTIPYFKSFQYYQNLRTTGAGFNMKFGLIFKPSDYVRIGAAVHTPTWYNLTDEYSTSMNSDLEDGYRFNAIGPVFIPFNYNIETPFRVIGSLALIAGKTGAINFDYEYLNYNQGRIDPDDPFFDASFSPVNEAMRVKYTDSHNFRVGGELRSDMLRFRAGAFYSSSPFEEVLRDSEDNDMSTIGYTGGIGYRDDRYFIDVGYSWSRSGSFEQPYTLSNQETEGITFRRTDNRVMITMGLLF